jgi:hypothetical protein
LQVVKAFREFQEDILEVAALVGLLVVKVFLDLQVGIPEVVARALLDS